MAIKYRMKAGNIFYFSFPASRDILFKKNMKVLLHRHVKNVITHKTNTLHQIEERAVFG